MSEKEKRPVHEFDRKGIKKFAHANIRKHFVFFLFLCLILIFMGTEYNSATGLVRAEASPTGSA